MRNSQKEEMTAWLEANPGKTERDWLIDVRCKDDEERKALADLIDNCEYAGIKCYPVTVNLLDELDEFCNSIPDEEDAKKFKTIFSEFLKKGNATAASFDLYFPSKHWAINIGSELQDALSLISKSKSYSYFWEINSSENIALHAELKNIDNYIKGFNEFLKQKYYCPLISRNRSENSDLIYLPWNHKLQDAGRNINDRNVCVFDMGTVSIFIHQLFGNDFEKVSNRCKEIFLQNHPEIKEQRATMLDNKVNAETKGGKLSIGEIKMRKLLQTVDNELYTSYPEYKKACLL